MKKIIGKKDKADFPLFGLDDIQVKVDTGAYTSSMHCSKISIENAGENKIVKFILLDPKHPKYTGQWHSTQQFVLKKVRSSNGKTEQRALIKTDIKLFGTKYKIDLTLTNRGDMRYPVLLGRKLLNKKFLVDTSLSNLSYNQKQNK